MSAPLIRYDLSLPHYFSYPPAPGVETRPMIPRKEERQLFMRGEFGIKPDGKMRPISAHSTTHLDVPHHFFASGKDVSAVLNRPETVADRAVLAHVVSLGGREEHPGSFTRDGVTYCESVSGDDLPPSDVLKNYDAVVVLTGFGKIMTERGGEPFTPANDGWYHVPHLQQSAVERILESGLGLVAIDSTTVEEQTSFDPLRFGSDVHFQLLGNDPPVLIVECLGGGAMAEQVGYTPTEGLLQIVPRRVNERGAEAAHGRVFLYFYRGDDGSEIRNLAATMTVQEFYG